jgi:integrase
VTLWKRGKVWWVYFYLDGIRHQYSTGTANRRQAETVEQKLRQDANLKRHQVIQVDQQLTFGALAARFIANAGPKAHHLDRLKVLLPYFADVPVVRITKGMARDYRVKRVAQKPVSEATVNRDLAVLRHLLYWAVDESLLLANPLARLPMARERRARRPVMAVEEEQAVLAVAPEHLKRIVIAALDTGMRRGELLNQLWEHMDFSRRVLFVTRSKTPEGEAREIPLSTRLFDLLWETRENEGLIFTYRGSQVRFLKTAWRTALKRAALRHFRFHDLRHTFNTRLMEAGVMQEVRKALMGHVSGDRVHSIYTHVELPVKREAIRKLEQWVQTQTQLTGG